jgi:FAD/FMN-containing dehydrogenase
VRWIVLVGGDLEIAVLSPRHRAEEFWATVGGMGFTGVIATVSLQLSRLPTGPALQRRQRPGISRGFLDLLEEAAAQQRGDPTSMPWR